MHNQINDFVITKLFKCQYGFRNGFGKHHYPLLMMEKLQQIQVFAAVFTDLSGEFDER